MADAQSMIDKAARDSSAGTAASRFDQLAELWSVRVPIWLDPWAPRVADAFTDGAWTVAWRKVAASLPVVAFVVGFLAPLAWRGTHWHAVYSESLAFLIVVIAGAILSGSFGAMLLLGYVSGVLMWGSWARLTLFDAPLRRGGSLLISYLLLAIPALRISLLARRMAEELSRARAPIDVAVRSLLYASACGALVYLWCQAMIALIRPIFTWVGAYPIVAAIAPVQQHWRPLVAVAVLAALVRMGLEEIVVKRSPRYRIVEAIQFQRWIDPDRHGELWRRLPAGFHVALMAGLSALLLAGLYEDWVDALLVAAGTGVLGAFRLGLLGGLPSKWIRLLQRVPTLIRYGVALAVGVLVAHPVIHSLWGMGNFRPVLLAGFIILVMFYLLFPSPLLPGAGERRQAR